jgi:hypothetical protein
MVGWENFRKISDQDRAQAVWDKAMTPEAKEHMEKYMAFKAGHGPDPGPYYGPLVDFNRAIDELEQEEPEVQRE